MDAPEQIEIRPLARERLPFAQEIRDLAGWNQTDRDWERLLEHEPGGCFLATFDDEPAGTATTTTHADEVGWIGMVLVHPDFRKRGIATSLLRECIGYLRPRVRCLKLDATPAGQPVYEKLGFVAESRLARWEGRATDGNPASGSGREEISRDLDREAFGADRSAFLRRLARDSRVIIADDGHAMLRPGSRANYLGPVVARSPESARRLLLPLLASVAGEPVYWDIPDDNEAATSLALELGFSRQRSLIRMRLGEPGFAGTPALQWAIGAPETG